MDDLAPPPPDSGDGPSEAPAPIGGVWSEPLLAVDTVRYVGEPVAVVITDHRYQGEDNECLISPVAWDADIALWVGPIPDQGCRIDPQGAAFVQYFHDAEVCAPR